MPTTEPTAAVEAFEEFDDEKAKVVVVVVAADAVVVANTGDRQDLRDHPEIRICKDVNMNRIIYRFV